MTSLQFITHSNKHYNFLEGAQLALEGGCKWIQLRMKNAPYEKMFQTALQVQELCKNYQATFIIDDNVTLAKVIKADGVHLGLKDMPILEARKILGTNFIIGGTANNFTDILKHWNDGADYIGCGPFRFTTTKEKLAPTLGLHGYQNILEKMRQYQCPLPLVAIGGIQCNDIKALKAIGVNHIAVSGTILNAENPKEETQKIIKLLA